MLIRLALQSRIAVNKRIGFMCVQNQWSDADTAFYLILEKRIAFRGYVDQPYKKGNLYPDNAALWNTTGKPPYLSGWTAYCPYCFDHLDDSKEKDFVETFKNEFEDYEGLSLTVREGNLKFTSLNEAKINAEKAKAKAAGVAPDGGGEDYGDDTQLPAPAPRPQEVSNSDDDSSEYGDAYGSDQEADADEEMNEDSAISDTMLRAEERGKAAGTFEHTEEYKESSKQESGVRSDGRNSEDEDGGLSDEAKLANLARMVDEIRQGKDGMGLLSGAAATPKSLRDAIMAHAEYTELGLGGVKDCDVPLEIEIRDNVTLTKTSAREIIEFLISHIMTEAKKRGQLTILATMVDSIRVGKLDPKDLRFMILVHVKNGELGLEAIKPADVPPVDEIRSHFDKFKSNVDEPPSADLIREYIDGLIKKTPEHRDAGPDTGPKVNPTHPSPAPGQQTTGWKGPLMTIIVLCALALGVFKYWKPLMRMCGMGGYEIPLYN